MTSSLSRIRFGSNRGPLDAGADQHEGAGLHELRQAGLHRLGLAGALEHDVDGVVDHAHGLGHVRHLELLGVEHPRGADGGGQRLAAGGGLGAAHVVDAHAPAARRCSSAPIGPAPSTSTRSPGCGAALVDAVEGDRQRLGQRGGPGVEARRASGAPAAAGASL